MNKDSKKILFVGILITIIIGFLIIWILVEDHKSPHNTGYKNSHANNSGQLDYKSAKMDNLFSV
jgi:hypothetical protein